MRAVFIIIIITIRHVFTAILPKKKRKKEPCSLAHNVLLIAAHVFYSTEVMQDEFCVSVHTPMKVKLSDEICVVMRNSKQIFLLA